MNPKLKNNFSSTILDYKQSDVNGDGFFESIVLLCEKPYGSENGFQDNISILIIDPITSFNKIIVPQINSGYNATIVLGDFKGTGIDEILLSIDSGGSGGNGFFYIYSFDNNILREIFNFDKFNYNYDYDVIYKDYYKVEVKSKRSDNKIIIDISNKNKQYLSNIYTDKGTLKKPLIGESLGIGKLYPVDIEKNQVYYLYAIQRFIGISNSDTLGFIQTVLRWKKSDFQCLKVEVSINIK